MNEKQVQFIEKIRYHSENGVAPPSSQNPYWRVEAKRLFGTWSNACELAGLKTRKQQESQKSKETVLKEIKRLSKNGVAPSTTNLKKLLNQANYFYGSWAKACEKAGVKPRMARKKNKKTAKKPKPKPKPRPKKTENFRKFCLLLSHATTEDYVSGDTIQACMDVIRNGDAEFNTKEKLM